LGETWVRPFGKNPKGKRSQVVKGGPKGPPKSEKPPSYQFGKPLKLVQEKFWEQEVKMGKNWEVE